MQNENYYFFEKKNKDEKTLLRTDDSRLLIVRIKYVKRKNIEWVYISPSTFSPLPEFVVQASSFGLMLFINNRYVIETLYNLGKRHAMDNMEYFKAIPQRA